jgi:hypothetical protein
LFVAHKPTAIRQIIDQWFDGVFSAYRCATKHDGIKMFAVFVLFKSPFAENTIRLAAAPGASEEYFLDRAIY